MSLSVCVLASGSSGNCTYVASPRTRILVDAGLSGRRTVQSLGELAVASSAIDAICLTHEHQDHIAGLKTLHQRHGIPVYANAGTVEAVSRNDKFKDLSWKVFTTGQAFTVGDLSIEPFSVPHDAYDPVGFVVGCGDTRVATVSDMGMVTGLVRERLRFCRVIVLEANHDERMLQAAERPWYLKQRIAGRQGHLSNAKAAGLLAEIAGPHLDRVYLTHMSDDCNRPDLAVETVSQALASSGNGHVDVRLSYADRASEIWSSAEPVGVAPAATARDDGGTDI